MWRAEVACSKCGARLTRSMKGLGYVAYLLLAPLFWLIEREIKSLDIMRHISTAWVVLMLAPLAWLLHVVLLDLMGSWVLSKS